MTRARGERSPGRANAPDELMVSPSGAVRVSGCRAQHVVYVVARFEFLGPSPSLECSNARADSVVSRIASLAASVSFETSLPILARVSRPDMGATSNATPAPTAAPAPRKSKFSSTWLRRRDSPTVPRTSSNRKPDAMCASLLAAIAVPMDMIIFFAVIGGILSFLLERVIRLPCNLGTSSAHRSMDSCAAMRPSVTKDPGASRSRELVTSV
jgi:hypothetical protein